jgi:IS605 OrfB family transposase
LQNSVSQTLPTELRNEDDVEGQIKNTMTTVIVTNKILIPHNFFPILNTLLLECQRQVKVMLKDRSRNSSKYYPSLPCVVSKSLISKYQRNKKCNTVKNCVIPICGDKGKVVKLKDSKIRIPAIFKKEELEIYPLKPINGHILSVEIFRRKGKWYLSYSYKTLIKPITKEIKEIKEKDLSGFVGVDRNVRDNVATLADISTGYVKRIGPDIKLWKDNLKNRRKKLQRKGTKGAKNVLVKINRKQNNRTRDVNHKVSKEIVDYAVKHRKIIVLEDLGKIKNSKKCGKFVQKSNWAFFQLDQFIKYKSSLYGIPVIYIDPRNTSKGCSRCGSINVVTGKKFKCKCGHIDHRDSNAAFNIGKLGFNFYNQTGNERELPARPIDGPLTNQGLLCKTK